MRHLAKRGHEVTAVSRRRPHATFDAGFRSLDLCDASACQALARDLPPVTHVVYAALFEKPGLITGWLEPDQIATNARMFENLLGAFDGDALRHVTLLQGTKAYGAHVRPIPLPAREDRDEARDVPNFYWEQEDHLRHARGRRDWTFTILRPQIVFGVSVGAAMNLIPAIGVYAALVRERGEPLRYPGGEGPVVEAVDADLLARAIAWGGETPEARDQVFNVTNGDAFTWRNVWPAIAAALDMEVGDPAPLRLGEAMPPRADEWDAVRAKHDLIAPAMLEFVGESFHYADFTMAHGAEGGLPPALVSTVKIRQAGFHEAMDTEAMFQKWFRILRRERWLP